MIVNMQIAFGTDIDIKTAMAGDLFEHVIEERYARRAMHRPTVEVDRHVELGDLDTQADVRERLDPPTQHVAVRDGIEMLGPQFRRRAQDLAQQVAEHALARFQRLARLRQRVAGVQDMPCGSALMLDGGWTAL